MKFKNICKSLFVYFGLGDRFNSNLKLCFIRMFSFDYGFKLRLLYRIWVVQGGPKKVIKYGPNFCLLHILSVYVHLSFLRQKKMMALKYF